MPDRRPTLTVVSDSESTVTKWPGQWFSECQQTAVDLYVLCVNIHFLTYKMDKQIVKYIDVVQQGIENQDPVIIGVLVALIVVLLTSSE